MATIPTGGFVEVVRIPELPEEPTLANEDKVPIWHAATNVTEAVTLGTLRTFVETGGGGGTLDAVLTGGTVLYIVPASAEGGTDFNYPAIAGKQFKLTRDGYPMKPNDEYTVLVGGGFHLIGTTLVEGQRYELDIFELFAGGIPPASGDPESSGFIRGVVNVNTNLAVSVNEVNKIHQIRGGSSALTLTLPDIALVPEKGFYIFETLINNTKQSKIITTGGQYIYMNDEAVTQLYIGKGEYIWAYRGEDGWYIIVDKGNFENLGVPVAAYKARINQVELLGQTLVRADYPRLWDFIQTLGASFVTDSVWNTASAVVEGRTVSTPYQGCFSDGNGTTTFRLPNYSGMYVRGLKNYGISDSARAANIPGNKQLNEVISHQHKIWGQDNTAPASGTASPEVANIENAPPNDIASAPAYFSRTSGLYGGTETRVDNIGLRWFINY